MPANAPPIKTKVAQLVAANFDLGEQRSNIVDAEFGGFYQLFANATVCWHPQVGDTAHVVYGNIKKKWETLGGFGPHPQSGKRVLGYPTSDETDTKDRRCRVSYFEWGTIYSIHGAVSIWGKLNDAYKQAGGEGGRLGYPVADPVSKAGGEIAFFEYGCLWYGTLSGGKIIEFTWTLPQIGHPWMLKPTEVGQKVVAKFTTLLQRPAAEQIAVAVFSASLMLTETGVHAEIPIGLRLHDISVQRPGGSYEFSLLIVLDNQAVLKDRQLYDIRLKRATGEPYALAPHSLYVRGNWKNFKFIHATDSHVSRRLDGFLAVLQAAEPPDGGKSFNNFNETFRLFIRYANRLYKRGNLDFILLTGDVVDYVFEDGGRVYQNNNFAFFEALLLGKGKKAGVPGEPAEELLVPIFTSLGNHDYRVTAYYPTTTLYLTPGHILTAAVDNGLLFVRQRLAKLGVAGEILSSITTPFIDVPKQALAYIWDTIADLIPGGDTVKAKILTKNDYATMNLIKKEAIAVTGEKNLKIGPERGMAMVTPDEDNKGHNLDYYFRRINRDQSYTVALDNHRIVMIDGKWDKDAIDSLGEALAYKLADSKIPGAALSDDAMQFGSGSPNSVGFEAPELQQLRNALTSEGLVIVGVHNPSVSPFDGEYPYFFRESLRTSRAFEAEMKRYFKRRIIENPTGWSTGATPHFAEGLGDNALDNGIMRGMNVDFMKIAAGADGGRPVDLVLAGHTHNNWECRIRWQPAKNSFAFYADFYTENPSVYYHSGNAEKPGENIHITVSDNAPATLKATKDANGILRMTTPSNPGSLDKQSGGAAGAVDRWWKAHRPLMIHTEALGPMKSQRGKGGGQQPDLHGCRHVTVANDLIIRVHSVARAEMAETVSHVNRPPRPPGLRAVIGG